MFVPNFTDENQYHFICRDKAGNDIKPFEAYLPLQKLIWRTNLNATDLREPSFMKPTDSGEAWIEYRDFLTSPETQTFLNQYLPMRGTFNGLPAKQGQVQLIPCKLEGEESVAIVLPPGLLVPANNIRNQNSALVLPFLTPSQSASYRTRVRPCFLQQNLEVNTSDITPIQAHSMKFVRNLNSALSTWHKINGLQPLLSGSETLRLTPVKEASKLYQGPMDQTLTGIYLKHLFAHSAPRSSKDPSGWNQELIHNFATRDKMDPKTSIIPSQIPEFGSLHELNLATDDGNVFVEFYKSAQYLGLAFRGQPHAITGLNTFVGRKASADIHAYLRNNPINPVPLDDNAFIANCFSNPQELKAYCDSSSKPVVRPKSTRIASAPLELF